MSKAVPATTDEACARYGATATRCACPDATRRNGGSYISAQGRTCKHKAHKAAQLATRAQVNISRLFPTAEAVRAVGQVLRTAPPAGSDRFAWLELA